MRGAWGQPHIPGAYEQRSQAMRKSRRFFKHLATLPKKLRAIRERQRQDQLQTERIQKLSGLMLKRLSLDDPTGLIPATAGEIKVRTEEKRQLSRQIAALKKQIIPKYLEDTLKVVDKVNGERLMYGGNPPAKPGPVAVRYKTRVNFWGRTTRGGVEQ